MTELRTPDELTAENELICEKLLGWKRAVRGTLSGCQFWDTEPTQLRTLSFTTWEEAGLILNWLMSHMGPGLERIRDDLALHIRNRTLTPLNIRAAALAYIRSLP